MALPTDPKSDGGQRLESWKEIAAYLNRDRRTVQRWEAKEGLPVHRHVHESLATVFAYTAELDAWQAKRQLTPTEESVPAAQSPGPRIWTIATIGLLLMLGLAAAGFRYSQNRFAFQQHDLVLVDAFQNRSGEAPLDGTLQNALQRELSNSRFVSVASRERVEDTLLLMRKPADTKLNAALAREVCLRDGGIRALITGTTEKLGSSYVFSAELIDPFRNRTVVSHSETAGGPDQIAPAIRKLSDWVRESLGEAVSQIEVSNKELEKVTTPSLRAWQLFTEADAASRRKQWGVSAQLNRQAVTEDPGFASAHVWLAWALFNLRDEEWKAEAQRALDLSASVSERERVFIVASNHMMKRQYQEAIPPLESLMKMHPDFYYTYPNLANAYWEVGRGRDRADVIARIADMRPNDILTNSQAGQALLPFDVERSINYSKRARELSEVEPLAMPDGSVVMFSRVKELWAQDDAEGALEELRRLERSPVKSGWTPFLAAEMAEYYLMLGRVGDARSWLGKFGGLSRRPAYWTLQLARHSGNVGKAREAMEAFLKLELEPRSANERDALLCVQLDIPGCANRVTALIGSFNPTHAVSLNGLLRLQDQRPAEAIPLLRASLDTELERMTTTAVIVGEGLSLAYEQSGALQMAAETLEQASAARLAGIPTSGSLWLASQQHLAELYRKLKRDQDARRVGNRLRKLLAAADPDYPLLRQLPAH